MKYGCRNCSTGTVDHLQNDDHTYMTVWFTYYQKIKNFGNFYALRIQVCGVHTTGYQYGYGRFALTANRWWRSDDLVVSSSLAKLPSQQYQTGNTLERALYRYGIQRYTGTSVIYHVVYSATSAIHRNLRIYHVVYFQRYTGTSVLSTLHQLLTAIPRN